MKKIKLAIVSNSLTPYREHLHKRIVDEVKDVELYSVFTHGASNAPWSQKTDEGIRPVHFGFNEPSAKQSNLWHSLHEWNKGGKIINWLIKNCIDALILYGYNDAGRIRILKWCKDKSVPCYIWGDSNIVGDAYKSNILKRTVKKMLLPHILHLATGVMVCGELGKKYYQKYGVDCERIYTSPYEPNYRLIESIKAEDVAKTVKEYSIDKTKKIIAYGGRLAKEKRVDILIKAFVVFGEFHNDWDLLIIGDGPLRSTLDKLVPDRLKKRIIWTGFVSDSRQLYSLYKCADIFVLPSEYEPWGIVVCEAAASGLAIITTDKVGSAYDLSKYGDFGMIVNSGDVNSLISAIEIMANEYELIRYKISATNSLNQWRKVCDPIKGIMNALNKENVARYVR